MKKLAISLFLSTMLLLATVANAIILDDFNSVESVTTNAEGQVIGGSRKFNTENLSSEEAARISLNISNGKLLHSQDALSSGISRILWDGDSTNNQENAFGLPSIDLKEDGSTSFELNILRFDAAHGAKLDLEIIFYSDKYNYASLSQQLSQSINENFTLAFPFAEFENRAGNADMQSVRAIELIIYGFEPALDLVLDSLVTDQCHYLAGVSGRVVDSCGVCQGNNLSCSDCEGVPNGTAKQDRCGVCNGDGMSCLNCKDYVQTKVLGQLDNGTLLQKDLIDNLVDKGLSLSTTKKLRRQFKSLKAQSDQLHLRAWQLVWSFPEKYQICTNQLFCSSNSHQQKIDDYIAISKELKSLANVLIAELKQIGFNGKKLKSYNKKAKKFYNQNMLELELLSKSSSSCS